MSQINTNTLIDVCIMKKKLDVHNSTYNDVIRCEYLGEEHFDLEIHPRNLRHLNRLCLVFFLQGNNHYIIMSSLDYKSHGSLFKI